MTDAEEAMEALKEDPVFLREKVAILQAELEIERERSDALEKSIKAAIRWLRASSGKLANMACGALIIALDPDDVPMAPFSTAHLLKLASFLRTARRDEPLARLIEWIVGVRQYGDVKVCDVYSRILPRDEQVLRIKPSDLKWLLEVKQRPDLQTVYMVYVKNEYVLDGYVNVHLGYIHELATGEFSPNTLSPDSKKFDDLQDAAEYVWKTSRQVFELRLKKVI